MALPDDFWDLRDGAIEDEGLRALHADVVRELRADAAATPGFGALEALMLERVAFLYIYIRDREAAAASGPMPHGFAHDRAYKETLQLWQGMAAGLQKQGAKSKDDAEVRQHVLDAVTRTISAVLDTFPPEEATALRERFALAFEDADF